MATKKPTQKPKQPPWTVTIRQVEDSGPCDVRDYFDCLALIKSAPVPDGNFAPLANHYNFKIPKKSRYGPDDPIPLSELVDILPNNAIGYLTGLLPVDLGNAVAHRAQEIERDSFTIALRELIAAPKAKGKKK